MALTKRYRLIGVDRTIMLVDTEICTINKVDLSSMNSEEVEESPDSPLFQATKIIEIRKVYGESCKFIEEADDPSEFFDMDDRLFPVEMNGLFELV